LRNLDPIRFLQIFPAIGALVAWRAILLWRGKIRTYSEANLNQGTSFFRTLRRYEASVPSLAIAFWSFIPAALFAHGADVVSNPTLRLLCNVVQWPFWFACVVFTLFALSIEIVGGPAMLVPPNMRKGRRLD
jgi:hypothetical protein